MRTPMMAMVMLLAASVVAQNFGEIRGKVVDEKGKPVEMVSVSTSFNGQTVSDYTDEGGRFLLKPLPSGKYDLNCFAMGYHKFQMTGIAVTDRATYLDDVVLIADSKVLPDIDVKAYRRKLIEIDDPGRMSLLASEIRKDPNIRTPGRFLETNFPGIVRDRDGGLHFRGSRSEDMVTFLDGVKISGSVPNLPPMAISSYSVYTGGLPARYGDVTGGVVVIETKTFAEVYNDRRAQLAQEEEAIR